MENIVDEITAKKIWKPPLDLKLAHDNNQAILSSPGTISVRAMGAAGAAAPPVSKKFGAKCQKFGQNALKFWATFLMAFFF